MHHWEYVYVAELSPKEAEKWGRSKSVLAWIRSGEKSFTLWNGFLRIFFTLQSHFVSEVWDFCAVLVWLHRRCILANHRNCTVLGRVDVVLCCPGISGSSSESCSSFSKYVMSNIVILTVELASWDCNKENDTKHDICGTNNDLILVFLLV